MGLLTSFFLKMVKQDPHLANKIILEQQEERNQLNSWKEQLVICPAHFANKKCENLKNVLKSIQTHTVSNQRH